MDSTEVFVVKTLKTISSLWLVGSSALAIFKKIASSLDQLIR